MENNVLYDSIFSRKSVRKFMPEILPEDKLRLIAKYIQGIPSIVPDMPSRILVLSDDRIAKSFAVKAPHYATIYSQKDPLAMINAGYQLEQLALALSACGLGCCWLGMAKPQKQYLVQDGLHYLIMLVFGTPDEADKRKSVDEFSRKSADEIADGTVPEKLVEAVRLAPSAMNKQPWYLTGDETQVHVWRKAPSGIMALTAKNMSYIDVGIALCHLELAAAQSGKSCTFEFGRQAPEAAPSSKYEYICSVLIGEKQAEKAPAESDEDTLLDAGTSEQAQSESEAETAATPEEETTSAGEASAESAGESAASDEAEAESTETEENAPQSIDKA